MNMRHAKRTLNAILKYYADLDMFAGYDIQTPVSLGPAGDTPFHMVAYDGDVEAAKLMLPFVHDLDMAGDNGYSPLHYAVSHNQLAMADFLIAAGADPTRKNDYGDTPIDLMDDKALTSKE